MAMTAEEKKAAQRTYQARYQRSAKGKLVAKKKMAPGQAWRLRHTERLAETREIADIAGRRRARWTAEEDQILRTARERNESYREIALTLARSQQSVQRRADQLGIPIKREKVKPPKPLVVLGSEISQIEIDEIRKYMRRHREFTAPALREHYREKFPRTLDMEAAFRMIDNLLRRDARAGRVKCIAGRGNTSRWQYTGD